MDPLVPSLAATKLFPRLLFPALCCTIVPAGCTRNDSLGTADRHDASQSETAGPGSETAAPDGNPPSDTRLVVPAEVGTCSNYPSAPRVDSAGVDQWSWYLHWFGVTGDLASTCASYGAGAKMVLEVDVPQDPAASNTLPDCSVDEVLNGASQVCAIAGAYRFEADCAAGKVLFEMPSQYTFHGYYHIEGPLVSVVYRQLVSQDVHCTRDLYLPTGLAAAPSVGDAGAAPADATADGSTCPSPGALAYDSCAISLAETPPPSASTTVVATVEPSWAASGPPTSRTNSRAAAQATAGSARSGPTPVRWTVAFRT